MFTHKIVFGWKDDRGGILTQEIAKTAGRESTVSENIPQSSTNLPVAFTGIVAKMLCVFLKCDQAITIKTNSSGSPAATINLLANSPWQWTSDEVAGRNPFGATDVSSLFVTVGAVGAQGANLEMRVLEDPT